MCPPAVSSCVQSLLVDFFSSLVKFVLFHIPFKLILLCTCWPAIQFFTSNHQITEMYKCHILEAYSMPMLYDWVESGLFDFFRSESTVPAGYMSLLIILIDLFGSQKDAEIMCMWISEWVNCTWILRTTPHPCDSKEPMDHCLHHL